MEDEPDNLVYIDEFRREQWLLKLKIARQTGQMALFNKEYETPGQLILFPTQPDSPPDNVA